MRDTFSTGRVLTLFVASLGVRGCGSSESPSAEAARLAAPGVLPATAPADEPTGTFFLEEDCPDFYVELSRSSIFSFETYSSLRFVPWRQVTTSGSEVKVRMSLGYGMGLSPEVKKEIDQDALDRKGSKDEQAMAQYFYSAMNNYTEHTTFQMGRSDVKSLLKFIESFEKIELRSPPPHVSTRFVQGHWGDLHVQKNDSGMFVSVPEKGWEPLAPDRFKAALRRALSDMERLADGSPSVRW